MKDTSAVDPGPGPIRDDLWNMAEEGGLDEFLSTIPDGDEVSALGGGEKSKGGGLANWDVLDEALSADIATSSAPALVAAGKKKSPPSSDLRPDTPMGHTANGDANGFGGDGLTPACPGDGVVVTAKLTAFARDAEGARDGRRGRRGGE